MSQARRFGKDRIAISGRSFHRWLCENCNVQFTTKPQSMKRGKRVCPDCGTAVLHFDSQPELHRWQSLRQDQREGFISGLRHHPSADLHVPTRTGELERIGRFEADSCYTTKEGEIVWEDVKPKDPRGIDTLAQWKIRHFEHQYSTRVRITH